jgi:predicted nucleotidyltransferase
MLSSSALADRLAAFFGEYALPGVTSAYLFGSHADARAHRESDVDVAVLLDRDVYADEQQRFEARLRLIGDVGAAVGSNSVDLVVLNDAPPSLARAIVTRGRRLFCNDSEADHGFVRTTLLRAADLEPWLQRMRRIKLDAIRR